MIRARMIAVLALVGVAASLPVLAAGEEVRQLPGFVDGSAFAELAGEESELVEIALGPSMLRSLAGGAEGNNGVGAVLNGLKAVNAVIVGLDHDHSRIEKASRLVRDLSARLVADRWERVAQVRDGGENVTVLVRNVDGAVSGLVVLVLERGEDESELVFVNIVGTLDLAKLGELEQTLDIPGLDKVGGGEGKQQKPPQAHADPGGAGDPAPSPPPGGDEMDEPGI
jgi:hypothetical protein